MRKKAVGVELILAEKTMPVNYYFNFIRILSAICLCIIIRGTYRLRKACPEIGFCHANELAGKTLHEVNGSDSLAINDNKPPFTLGQYGYKWCHIASN